MSIVKWAPFREMATLHEDVNRLFSRFDGAEVAGQKSWMLSLDVVEEEGNLKLSAALPGVDPKDVHIEVEDDQLTIRAERKLEESKDRNGYRWIEQQYGSFSRSVTIPRYVDSSKIEATYKHGTLELILPKMESAKPRKIELKESTREPQLMESQ